MKKTHSDPSFFADLTPSRYDLPKFAGASLRPAQIQMADHILLEGAGITVHSAPTGTGKSLGYVLPALETGGKAVVLTATKALQDQLLADFSPRVADLRGAQNFQCAQFQSTNCAIGGKLGCSCREPGARIRCQYVEQFSRAASAGIVVTNYAMWFALAAPQSQNRIAEVRYLVADEAHLLVDLLTEASSARFSEQDFRQLGLGGEFSGSRQWDIKRWREWAFSAQVKSALADRISAARKNADAKAMEWAMSMERALESVGLIPQKQHEHVIDWNEDAGVVISPVWPSQTFRRYFSAPFVVLASATITREICGFIGLKPNEYSYWEYDSGFPPELAPVYLHDGEPLSYRTEPAAWTKIMRRAVELADSYSGKRGIVYTGSYHRSRMLAEAVRIYGDPRRRWFFHDDAKGLREALDGFRSNPGSVLASPSIAQGYDFPDDLCEFVIVVKCPYPDMKSKVVAARMRKPTYMDASMALTLVQVCGRGVRHASDRCDSHVLDGAALRLYRSRPGMFPQWFRNRIRLAG